MTDTDIESYRFWIETMDNSQLDAETSCVVLQAAKGADVAGLMTALQHEYGLRGNPDGFLKVYNAAIAQT